MVVEQLNEKAKKYSLVSSFSHTIWAGLDELNFSGVGWRNMFDPAIGDGVKIGMRKSGIK